MTIPIDEKIRMAINQVLIRAELEGFIDKEAHGLLFERLDSALVKIEAGDAVRKAATEARDKLLYGCHSNGGWRGMEAMDAHSILVGAVGKPDDPKPWRSDATERLLDR